MTRIHLDHVTRQFEPSSFAVAGLDLHLADGEFVSLVGPSGCGKSTALRILAGFETPDDGHVIVDDDIVDDVPPHDRGFAMVSNADTMLPGRTARSNIAFPLELRARPRSEVELRVELEAASLSISHLLERRRSELSAGERQAVQMARSLVTRPRFLLLDEPFMRLDPQLKERFRGDLMTLQRHYGITTLLVTADQTDARSLSDRMAVLDRGHLQQAGTPADIYERPVNTMVAGFVGEPAMNMIDVAVEATGDERWYRIGNLRVRAYPEVTARYVGRTLTVGLRPEHLRLDATGPNRLAGRVESARSRGAHRIVGVSIGDVSLSALTRSGAPRIGDMAALGFEPRHFHLFDPTSGAALFHPT
ncbi:MAG: ABC transporter ATP-binding protein [Acidimicrobiales bacterium]